MTDSPTDTAEGWRRRGVAFGNVSYTTVGVPVDAVAKADRRFATRLAVLALRDAASAYIEAIGPDKYGAAIIELAEQLGGYLRDGRARE